MTSMNDSKNYGLFFKFIETIAPTGFQGIDLENPLLQELEEILEKNDQFFFVGDILKMKIIFCSARSKQMIGVEPENVTPYDLRVAIHPGDAKRFGLGSSKMFSVASNLFIEGKGSVLMSSNYKIRNLKDEYQQVLFQLYIFYNTIPVKSIYLLHILTNIDWFKHIKHGYHYYVGSDLSNFRFPDEKLLSMGNIFSDREFEILRLIASGMSSEEIGNKIFLSVHTINTHRRNLLKKTEKATTAELIYDLMERGVL